MIAIRSIAAALMLWASSCCAYDWGYGQRVLVLCDTGVIEVPTSHPWWAAQACVKEVIRAYPGREFYPSDVIAFTGWFPPVVGDTATIWMGEGATSHLIVITAQVVSVETLGVFGRNTLEVLEVALVLLAVGVVGIGFVAGQQR